MGISYLWGGLSSTATVTSAQTRDGLKLGIDCSGLVHVSHRQSGMKIPRDSHEQWMKAQPIKRAELKPADLIFSAKKETPKKISHVVLYAGNETILEAPQTGMLVRKISFEEKFGAKLETVENGQAVGDRILYFGRFLK
jgi:cell wall-associated NlpC family hydrolase